MKSFSPAAKLILKFFVAKFEKKVFFYDENSYDSEIFIS